MTIQIITECAMWEFMHFWYKGANFSNSVQNIFVTMDAKT